MIQPKETYEIVFDYEFSRFRYVLEDTTMDEALDFARNYTQNCNLITIKKVEEIYRKIKRNARR